MSKLTKDLSCSFFFPEFVIFWDLPCGKVQGIGRQNGGLYLLHAQATVLGSSLGSQHSTTMKQSVIWHRRLGHAPLHKMKQISSIKNLVKEEGSISNCGIHPLARQTRLPFPKSQSKTPCQFGLVHADVWGPLIDDYSRFCWLSH